MFAFTSMKRRFAAAPVHCLDKRSIHKVPKAGKYHVVLVLRDLGLSPSVKKSFLCRWFIMGRLRLQPSPQLVDGVLRRRTWLGEVDDEDLAIGPHEGEEIEPELEWPHAGMVQHGHFARTDAGIMTCPELSKPRTSRRKPIDQSDQVWVIEVRRHRSPQGRNGPRSVADDQSA